MTTSQKSSLIQEIMASTVAHGVSGTQKNSKSKAMTELKRCLDFHCYNRDLNKRVLSRLTHLLMEDGPKGLEAALSLLVKHHPLISPSTKGPLILVGLPGVGKTITAGKLACEALLQGRSVTLLTLDCLKAGAVTQIEKYGKALDVKVHVFNTASELINFSSTSFETDLQIIDTPGFNPANKVDCASILEIVIGLKTSPTVILPAYVDGAEALDQLKFFKTMGGSQIILTKIDCVRRYGVLSAVLSEEGWALSALSDAPELGKRLMKAHPSSLARLLEKAMKTTEMPQEEQNLDQAS